MPTCLTCFYTTCNLNGTSVQKEFLGERSLASIGVGDDGKTTATSYFRENGAIERRSGWGINK